MKMVEMRPEILSPNFLKKHGTYCAKNAPKMDKLNKKKIQNTPKWPKIVQNIQANSLNEYRNTNTKLPHQKW